VTSSSNRTLTPPPRRASRPGWPGGENLAHDATVTETSSEYSDSLAAELAIDGDTDTEWATAGDGAEGFIAVDLRAEQRIAGVEFVTRSMADGSSITSTYTVSVDGGAPLGPYPAGWPAEPRPVEIDATGRELRFEIEDSSGGNVGAVEILRRDNLRVAEHPREEVRVWIEPVARQLDEVMAIGDLYRFGRFAAPASLWDDLQQRSGRAQRGQASSARIRLMSWTARAVPRTVPVTLDRPVRGA
jgi:hypothetical protein